MLLPHYLPRTPMRIKPESPRRVTILDGTPSNPYEFWYDLDAETFKASLGPTTYEIAADEGGGSGPTKYAVTCGTADTAAKEAILTVSIPAGTWADCEIIRVAMVLRGENNSSTETGFTIQGEYGASSATISPTIGPLADGGTAIFTASWDVARVGTTIYFLQPGGVIPVGYQTYNNALKRVAQQTGFDTTADMTVAADLGGSLTTQDFSTTKELRFCVTLSAVDGSNISVACIAASVIK